MLPLLTDTHCHLDFDSFDQDRDEVIGRARQAGVGRVLNPGVDLPSSRSAVAFTQKYAELYAAVGVHPNDALSFQEGTIDELRRLAAKAKVVAIGEIGLDYYRDRAPKEVQCSIFHQQLDLAAELGLPVVIHNRNANTDIMQILEKWHSKLIQHGSALAERPGVMHSFSGDDQMARQAVAMNFFIGISGPVTFLNAKNLPLLVAGMPLDNLLIETDAPFLTPHPHRGQRNEPAHVRWVAEKIASLKNTLYSTVAEQTRENAARLFQWEQQV